MILSSLCFGLKFNMLFLPFIPPLLISSSSSLGNTFSDYFTSTLPLQYIYFKTEKKDIRENKSPPLT